VSSSRPFSIIILCHNKADYTRRCVESILSVSADPVEIICIDNGSTDATPDILRDLQSKAMETDSRLLIVRNGENVGCSTGRNQGIRLASGRWLMFLDNDTEIIQPGWLRRLAAVLESDARIGVVGPKLIYPDNDCIQFAGGGVTRSGRVVFLGRGERRDDPRFNQQREVQTFISACMMFRASLPKQIGYLDEAFNPVMFEDIDYCYRARAAGYRVLYVPSVEVVHRESVTTAGTKRIANTYLIVKHGVLFKKRWRWMFEREDGPPDDEAKWRKDIPMQRRL